MLKEELKYLLGIVRFQKIGAARLKCLMTYFPSYKDAFQGELSDLIFSGLAPNIAEEFVIQRNSIDPDKELELLNKEGLKVITSNSEAYSDLLKEAHNHPALLFYKGNLNLLKTNCLAVVGTRRISNYGRQILPDLIVELIKNDLTIVSGLALGIDSLAHKTTIDHAGKTIAVLGSGLDKANIYPTSNRYLAEQILENNGLIVSEFPIGTLPLSHNFPARNRIISGLSLGTLVVEAGETSGALITAKYALDQNREVFAVPGPINSPTSLGPNNLIKQGAKATTSTKDILDELNMEKIEELVERKKEIDLSVEEKLIWNILKSEPIHIDKISRLTGLPASKINANVTIMEMKGLIRDLGNQMFVKS
ncbi:MAG TPA: DNA-processing protein DprA [Candidatus Bipolaricaulota bacterium]|nr:DNA-processing protein DprA [Candidatus Bipolaricaulota bacterium]